MKQHSRLPTWTGFRRTEPTFLLASWFCIVLAIGTTLLALPLSHRPGVQIGIFTALFTAVSAFCVTGLIVVDTAASFSTFGQSVILVLMELGGVGIMTFAALAFSIMGRRLSLKGRAALTDTLFQNNPIMELKSIFKSMLKAVLLIQIAGIAFLYFALPPTQPGDSQPDRLWSAAFHSVSAFCNAGFALYPDNLVPLSGNALFLSGIMALVILGGLGHGVLAEILRIGAGTECRRRLSANSRVVLAMSAALLAAGAAALALTDAIYRTDAVTRTFDSVFHAVVARTAGFNTAPLDTLPLASCLILCILMFVGGSPGSCAGGIKTTSLAIWLAHIAASVRLDGNVRLLGYSIPDDLVGKSRIIIAISSLWVISGTLFLSLCHPEITLDKLLFEQISALATVGLSMGITASLNGAAQSWIIISMVMGKFGPLTIALWMVNPTQAKIRQPEGRLMIG